MGRIDKTYNYGSKKSVRSRKSKMINNLQKAREAASKLRASFINTVIPSTSSNIIEEPDISFTNDTISTENMDIGLIEERNPNVLCVSKSQSQSLNSTSNLSHSNQSHSFCEEGQPVVPPDECNTCTCFAGVIYCTNLSCPKQECIDGDEIPPPDECNKCICRQGKVMCTNMICIPAPNCAENLLYPTQNKCNTCMCLNGFITCTSNVCYEEDWAGFDPRAVKKTHHKKKCIEGSSIPVTNKCVECNCENGKKRCKYICSPTMELQSRFGDQSHSICQEGQPVVPPDECNTCTCFAGVMYCTNIACPEKQCVDGEVMPAPDACNKCICRRGQVMCTDMICIPAPNCTEKQLYPPPNKCNTCMCLNGFITCTSNACYDENWSGFDPRASTKTPKKKECEEGSSLPGPNKCVECFCENGRKRCKYICNPTNQLQNRFGDQSQSSCEEGQPVTPPDECNTCTCFAGVTYCTNLSCPDQKCVNGEEMLPPDACNKCVCRRGQVVCTNMICIPAPKCAENQLYPQPNKCNACMCLNGFITCTSNVCYEENWAGFDPRATTKTPNKKECEEGSILPGPNKCVECFCENGRKSCKFVCSPTMQLENRFAEPECISGQIIPPPDDCNNCICFEGEIHCTHMPCHTDMRIGRECRDDQPVFRPDECNECYCFEGRLECSDLVCIRGSRCVPGQVIPKPDNCNACKCVEGHILCTNYQCPTLDPRIGLTTGSSPTGVGVKPLDECHDGDVIPPLPPPHDCKTCYCIENTIMCTVNTCVDTTPGTQHSNAIEVDNFRSPNIVPLSFPEIKGRLKEQNEQSNLRNLDKQISVEPFIDILYKQNNKLPTKVIHTHAYNGFHQEIKIHANHLPKDATSLLKVLATSLDNAALASISQSLLTSPDTPSNTHDSTMPFNQKGVQNNLLDEGNVITTQSSKLITSGSQSNETIYVIPNSDPFESENPQSIMPLTNKHETIWKTVSAPALIVKKNNQPINPQNSLEENMNVHHDDIPSPILPSIEQSNMIRNPSKFSHPGALPKPARDTLNINTQYNPKMNPKPININDGKKKYAPFYQENNQFKPVPQPFHTQPLQSPFVQYYPNRIKPQEFPSIPYQNQPSQMDLPTFNNKAIQNPLLFPNTQNLPMVSANQYKPPQFGLKPIQGNTLNNINNQQFKQVPPQNGVNPEHFQNEPKHSHFVPNPSIYYKNEYEAPKINEVNLDEKQTSPHSKTFNTPTEHHSQPHTFSELDHDKRNKTKRYNTTHSHYEKHTTITYLSEFDPNDPAHKNIVGLHPNPNHNALHTNEYGHYSPDQESQERDLTRSKVNYYLNLPTKPNAYQDPREVKPDHEPSELETPQNNHLIEILDERGSADGFQYPSNSAEDQHPKTKLNTLQILSAHFDPDTSHYGPARPKDDLHILHSQFGPAQNQHKPGILDNHRVDDEYHFAYNANQNPTQLKPVYKLPNFPLDPTLNQHKAGTFDERGSTDGFQYPSNSAEKSSYPKEGSHNPPHSKENLHKPSLLPFDPTQNQYSPSVHYPSHSVKNPSHPKQQIQKYSPYGPAPNQPLSGILDERGSADGFQYPSHSTEDPLYPKQNIKKPPNSPYDATPNQYLPETFDERGSADGFQYPSHSTENPLYPKQNIKKPPNSPYDATPNQYLPGTFDERGSADGFQYPSHSTEDPLYPKQNIKKPPNSQYDATPNQYLPGTFEKRGSGSGVQYPSHSAESPLKTKYNKHYPKQSQFQPSHNQYNKNIHSQPNSPFGPMQDNGFQFPSHSAVTPLQTKYPKNPSQSQFPSHNQFKENINKPPFSPFDPTQNKQSAEYPTKPKSNLPHFPVIPTQNQHTDKLGGSADGFQYPSHSAKNTESQLLPAHNQYKGYIHKPPSPPFGPTQNQYLPVVFDKKQSSSSEDPTYSESVTQNLPHPQLGPAQSHQKDNKFDPSNFPLGPTLINSLPKVLDERGSADGFQYPSYSAEVPSYQKNNPDKTPNSKLISKIFNDNNDNPLRPTHLDHYKPSSFDDLLNVPHNIPWSVPEDHEKVLSTITSAPKPRVQPEHDQYKPSSFDNLLNEIHQIPWPIPNQDNGALKSDTEITTPQPGSKPKKDEHEPSKIENPSLSSISNQNNLPHESDNEQQEEQDISAPTTELTNIDSTEFNPHPEIKADSDPVSDLAIDDDKIPDYYDQLYPLLNAVKKLSEPPFDDSTLSVDQLDLLPLVFPGIAKILNNEPDKDQDDALPVEDQGFQRISPLLKLKSKLKQLPNSGKEILNWLKSKLLKFVPQKYNGTVNPNDIDMTKIFNLLKKLRAPKIKDNPALQNIPFGSFDPDIIESIMNDFQENTLTTTPNPHFDTTQSYGNRFKTIAASDEKEPQAPKSKYPDVHIIIHQANDEGDLILPPYMETEGAENLTTDMSYEELGDPLFSKIFNHRFRHRPKDQTDECGDGTHWISNCHGCSCSFGQPMCYKMHDCVLRPLGEPMACKPYSHFKMGCYTCECNGDGVAECEATDCNPKSSEKIEVTTENVLPVFNEFFDIKEADEILQYYNVYKKLPKDCPKQDLQVQYPTCERGTSWVSSCHKCECNENGQHECSKIDDCKLDLDSYGKPGRCKPNTKFYPKTNSMPCVECSCNDEGHPYCPTVDYKKH